MTGATSGKGPAILRVKVVPGASNDVISGWLGDELKVRLRQPPEDGKANRALLVLLAALLGVPVKHLQVARGATSPHKQVTVSSLSNVELLARLHKQGHSRE